jgi:hypothetical protein
MLDNVAGGRPGYEGERNSSVGYWNLIIIKILFIQYSKFFKKIIILG